MDLHVSTFRSFINGEWPECALDGPFHPDGFLNVATATELDLEYIKSKQGLLSQSLSRGCGVRTDSQFEGSKFK